MVPGNMNDADCWAHRSQRGWKEHQFPQDYIHFHNFAQQAVFPAPGKQTLPSPIYELITRGEKPRQSYEVPIVGIGHAETICLADVTAHTLRFA